MKHFFNQVLFFLLIFSISTVFAQDDKLLKGKIVDTNGKPLAQVIVVGDEGDVISRSNNLGEFSIQVLFSDVLLFEKDGFISKQLTKGQLEAGAVVELVKEDFLQGSKDQFQLPFRKISRIRSTGSINQVDVKELQSFDFRQGRDAALNGKLPGLFGTLDTWNRGNALIVVDGVPRTNNYEFYLREAETITLLKDPVSRSLYGSLADKGVLMVTTRRGKAYKKEINLQFEYGIDALVENTLPKFMGAADYMETYNTVVPGTYSTAKIQDTRAGLNPHLNPDVDFYGDQFIRSFKNGHSLFFDASGGNSDGQYFLNFGWKHSDELYNLGSNHTTDNFNIRANIDFKLTSTFKLRFDLGAIVNLSNSPNITDYWKRASEILPNSYPLLWSSDLIRNSDIKDEVLLKSRGRSLLFGGNKTFANNLYADFIASGSRSTIERNIQVNSGFDWDLKSITKGLKLGGQLSVDWYNTLVRAQGGQYIVYDPVSIVAYPAVDPTVIPALPREVLNVDDTVGQDVFASNFDVKKDEMLVNRREGAFANLTYDKSFGLNDLSLVAVVYRDLLSFNEVTNKNKDSNNLVNDGKQDKVNFTYGLSGNFAHNSKYLVDFSTSIVGSQKLPVGDKYAQNASIGLGWILTGEQFMKDVNFINYLKIRGSAGILYNDNWDNYFLYTTAYETGSSFTYGNGLGSNNEVKYLNREVSIDWQKRNEFVAGFDAAFANRKLWIETNVFESRNYDQITELKNSEPLILGTETLKYYDNFNDDRVRGFDVGLRYESKFSSNSSITVGSNIVSVKREILRIEEPVRPYDYLYRTGTDPKAIWGLQAQGLYGVSDFDTTGNLNQGLPMPSFGKVAPGDVRYKDVNNDGKISSLDETVIGRSAPTTQYSVHINLKVNNWEFYALGVGSLGDYGQRTGNYHKVSGFMKYPEHLKSAYSSSNPDVNAVYPRITSTASANNNQVSTFWLYKNNTFSIPALQLTYNILPNNSGNFKSVKVFIRGTDLFRVDPNFVYNNVKFGNEPKTRTFAIGIISKF